MAEKLGFNKLGGFEYSPIIAGSFPIVTDGVNLEAGAVYAIGSVLGKVTATGACKLVDSTASDGSETVYAVLMEEVDATTEARPGAVYLTGEFIRHRLVFGGNDTWETHELAARERSIFFKDAAKQPNE